MLVMAIAVLMLANNVARSASERGKPKSEQNPFGALAPKNTTDTETMPSRTPNIVPRNESGIITGKYTIVLNAFRRDDKAIFTLRYYAAHLDQLPDLDRLILLWNDYTRPIPKAFNSVLQSAEGRILSVTPDCTNISNRFRLFPEIRTQAIFSQDEDLWYSPSALRGAFELWQEDPDAAVGFHPRLMKVSRERYFYKFQEAMESGVYNGLFATKGAFLHRKFYHLFFADTRFAEVLAVVDEHTTGEDIMMLFVHAIHTGKQSTIAVSISHGIMGQDNSGNKKLSTSTAKYRPLVMKAIRKSLGDDGLNAIEKDKSSTWCFLPGPKLQNQTLCHAR